MTPYRCPLCNETCHSSMTCPSGLADDCSARHPRWDDVRCVLPDGHIGSHRSHGATAWTATS